VSAIASFSTPAFSRLGVVLKPNASVDERLGVLNPACARLSDGTLYLYPRMVAPGNVSRIGSFRARERTDGTLEVEPCGYALEPEASYELREEPGGYGCEDPRVTFVAAIDSYVMAYVAFGPRGPEIAVAVSRDGLTWLRLGLLRFKGNEAPFADKDAAFFPEPVESPAGVESLAFYHRPTLAISVRTGRRAAAALDVLPASRREGISVGYVPLAAVRADIGALRTVTETHPLALPEATWGTIKVGCGTPPVRIEQGWLSIIHGVDELPHPSGAALLRYCAGIIVHDPTRLERIIYRSREPLFAPEVPGEVHGTVGYVVFPTGIDPRGDGTFDVYYGMADYEIGRGRLALPR
jgi:beta-1,2-mannobiose phosphorylase / 1,2-beta-oligomannan phosphorylase